MTVAESFSKFLDNIKVDNYEKISQRYKEITKKLNKTYRDTDSEVANSLQVGSYGRYTGIKGISDLDMLYIMPQGKWDTYKDSPKNLLADTRDAIQERYPTTSVHYDRLVVVVEFTDFKFEVQPVFEEQDSDGTHTNYKYPDSVKDCYKITKPKQEQEAMTDFKRDHGTHHRYLCKMMREWKNTVGVAMGGLLLDTLTYNFLNEREDLDNIGYSSFDIMCRDFLKYLKDQPKQDHYQALGSNQDVKVKHPFRTKAGESYSVAKKACEAEDDTERNDLWREVFGTEFPKNRISKRENLQYTDNEQFIEDSYKVNITNNVSIDCKIERAGFRTKLLKAVLGAKEWIPKQYSLYFFIDNTDVSGNYEVKWKVRNVGEEAKRRNCLRGQIERSNFKGCQRKETSNFYGPHYVECYIIKNNVVIARDRIDVPIER